MFISLFCGNDFKNNSCEKKQYFCSFAKKMYMACSTLYLVGNGMDKAADYPTGYSDFYQSIYFNKLLSDKNPIALYVRAKNTIENWADLEQELFNYANDDEIIALNPRLEDDFKQVRMALYMYIYNRVEHSRHREYNKKVLNLQHFLSQLFSEDKSIRFFSFNYTTIFDDIWEETNKVKPVIQHVHGTVNGVETNDNNIVFGIDETMHVKQVYNFLYKPYNVSFNNYEFLNAIKEAKRIIIFSCTMGDSDRWYFETLFNNCTHKIVEVIAYGEDERRKSMHRTSELTNRTIATFSSETQLKTFDNSNIGTLIHSRESYYKYDNPSFLDSLRSKS